MSVTVSGKRFQKHSFCGLILAMEIFQLNKSVLHVRNNAVEFLNGLTTNAMDKPWNAFVDIHGMLISVFDQIVLNEEEVMMVLDKTAAEAVLSHLDRYAKLSGVKIEKKEDLNVCFDLEGNVPLEPQDFSIPQKKGRLIITKRKLTANVSGEKFTLFRLRNNIPQQDIDFKREEFLLNISEHDHVSYTKGCFLGQEPISKVHNRSKPSWKLVVKAQDECSNEEKAKMTSKIADPATRRTTGFVFVSNKD